MENKEKEKERSDDSVLAQTQVQVQAPPLIQVQTPIQIQGQTNIETENNEMLYSQLRKLKEDKKRLKKELITRNNEVKNLQSLLNDQDSKLQSNYITLKEARKITYKALRKGSAAQNLIHIIEHNSINYKLKMKAFEQLVINAFGVSHNQKKKGVPDILKYTDSHLKLFRQEQLILLAENERLTAQMKELKKQVLDNKINDMKSKESTYVSSMKQDNSNKNIQGKRIDDNYVELDADVVETKFTNLIKNIKSAQLKLLYYAFRKLSVHQHSSSTNMNIGKNATRISLKHGIHMLNFILEKKFSLQVVQAFYLITNCKMSLFKYKNKLKDSGVKLGIPQSFYLPSVNEKLVQRNKIYNEKVPQEAHLTQKYMSMYHPYEEEESSLNGIPSYVYKPYYFDNLPSATVEFKNTTFKNLPPWNKKHNYMKQYHTMEREPTNYEYTHNYKDDLFKKHADMYTNHTHASNLSDMELDNKKKKHIHRNDTIPEFDFTTYDKKNNMYLDLLLSEAGKK